MVKDEAGKRNLTCIKTKKQAQRLRGNYERAQESWQVISYSKDPGPATERPLLFHVKGTYVNKYLSPSVMKENVVEIKHVFPIPYPDDKLLGLLEKNLSKFCIALEAIEDLEKTMSSYFQLKKDNYC